MSTETYTEIHQTTESTEWVVIGTAAALDSYLRSTFGVTLAAPGPSRSERLEDLRRRAGARRDRLGAEPRELEPEERDDHDVISEIQLESLYRWLSGDDERA